MRTHYRPTPARLALSLTSLAAVSSAIVLPGGRSRVAGVMGTSSHRRSLNFGPSAPAGYHSADSADAPALTHFNSLAPSLSSVVDAECGTALDPATCVGTAVATQFLAVLHPTSTFKLVDAYVSKQLGVLHAYYVQTVDGVSVANGNLNVNVDLATHTIASYGDSSFARSQSLAVNSKTQAQDWKDRVASWANQVVLGGSDNGPQGQEKTFSSPPLVPQHDAPEHSSSDPRASLLAFLALQAPSRDLSALVMSATVDDLTVVPSFTGDGSFTIQNAPSAVEPVKATRAYIHDGQTTTLTWKFEVRTDDNHYEAYVKDDDTLMVVDWVRDFQPTGGELGVEAVTEFKLLKNVRGVQKRSDGDNFQRPAFKIGHAGRPSKRSLVDGEEGLIDAEDVESVEAFKLAKPAYRVFPWGVNDPSDGKRELLKGSLIELDDEASPAGWHTIPSKSGSDKQYTTTRGNNVVAQDNPDGGNGFENNYRPDAGKDMLFDYKLHWPKAGHPLEPHSYINASVSELFYTNNEIHDLFHRYGFDESAGNFQEYNFGRGGQGGDAVQANAQDGSGMNNANFATPPDGQRPRMRMYSWSGSQPYRDGDFEAGIVIHEYSHGISTRLTGGPANSGCLGWGEAGGMGEGWGDFFATMIRQHEKNVTEYSMGEWASSRANGIRYYPYSLNMTVNPSTYKILDGGKYWGVHAIGEVWAEILFTVAELLIDNYGLSPTLFPPASNSTSASDFYNSKFTDKLVPKHGNTLAVQLVVSAMALQPCRPSFQDARDAILQADKLLTKGANECLLWSGFSQRGLGPDASLIGSTPWGGGIRTDDFKLPAKCAKGKKPKAFYA